MDRTRSSMGRQKRRKQALDAAVERGNKLLADFARANK